MSTKRHIPGEGCQCYARSEYECGCDADWRSVREVELEAKLTALCSAAIKEAAFIVVERMEFDEDYPASSERMCKSALRLKEAVAKSREE